MAALRQNANKIWPVFIVFLRLGLTSFGGPVAHLGYFRNEFVLKRQWLSEQHYADLVALCQFLPGPASSQLGMAIGLGRAGLGGLLAAWCGFTLPSAIALMVFAEQLTHTATPISSGLLHGLKLVAVAVVAQAVWGMARSFCKSRRHMVVAVLSAFAGLVWISPWSQIAIIAVAALIGLFFGPADSEKPQEIFSAGIRRRTGTLLLLIAGALLLGLPLAQNLYPSRLLDVFAVFYTTGAMVFGGGHVVLPLLQGAILQTGWLSQDLFLAGYGAAQAVPGPLFTFAAFLGYVLHVVPQDWLGGMLCLLAIFLPSLLLVMGALPHWQSLRYNRYARGALNEVNAAVVGVLLAALYQPIWISSVFQPIDFAFVLISLVALTQWRAPPWLVVFGAGFCGWQWL